MKSIFELYSPDCITATTLDATYDIRTLSDACDYFVRVLCEFIAENGRDTDLERALVCLINDDYVVQYELTDDLLTTTIFLYM